MSQGKPLRADGAQLTDFLAVSLLARVYPTKIVDSILNEQGLSSKRVRSFPATAGVYYCMGLSLYPEQAYESVFQAVSQGLAWRSPGAHSGDGVVKSAISKVRTKLGSAPLEKLVQTCCQPLGRIDAHPQAFFAKRRIVALDGSTLELPDERANAQAFGYPGSRTGWAAYPHARCAILVECATHAVLAAELGPYNTPERELCLPLFKRLEPGMLCLADRGFNGFEVWQQALSSGADLLWRMAKDRQFPVVKLLSDGTYISQIRPSRNRAKGDAKSMDKNTAPISIRVVEYELPNQPERYRLVTSLLDEHEAPGLELAALYHQRWQVEAVFDELKTHLNQNRRVLRSKTPALVRQEFFGWILAHYAVRWLMHEAADQAGILHAELSFIATVQLVKQSQPLSGAFPPSAVGEKTSVVARAAQKSSTASRD